MIPGRSLKCSYLNDLAFVEFQDESVQIYKSVDEIIPKLINALQNVTTDYARVISLGPALLLVSELLNRNFSVFLPVICNIKHFEPYKQNLSDKTWCCKLHQSIAKLLYEPTFRYICEIKDDEIFSKCAELYGKAASLTTRQRMFVRLCDSKKFTLSHARALVDSGFKSQLTYQLNDSLKNYFTQLFSEIEPKIIMFLMTKLPTDEVSEVFLERADLSDKWWWMIHLYRLSKLSYNYRDAFLKATVLLGEDFESTKVRFYRGLLQRIAKSPKAFWPHLLGQLKGTINIAGTITFDEKLARLLFCSEESWRIFKVVFEKGALNVLPFINFPSEYITFGLTHAHYRRITEFDIFESAPLDALKEVVKIFQNTRLANLNELLDFKLTDVFVPRAIAIDDYSFIDTLVKHPYDISIEDWKKVTLKTDYLYKVKREDTLKYLFRGLDICSEDRLEKSVELFLKCDERKEYIEQFFDPGNTYEYRLLLLHPTRAKLMQSVRINPSTFNPLFPSETDDMKNIRELIDSLEIELREKHPWRVLSKFPLGTILHDRLFWSIFVNDLFGKILYEQEARWQFCNEVTDDELLFLKEVYIMTLRYWEYDRDGKEEEANQLFFDFVL